MWEEYNETGNEIIIPNVNTYNTVMSYFSQLGYTVKVVHILLEVLDHEGSKDTLLRPNTEYLYLFIKSCITNDTRSSIYSSS